MGGDDEPKLEFLDGDEGPVEHDDSAFLPPDLAPGAEQEIALDEPEVPVARELTPTELDEKLRPEMPEDIPEATVGERAQVVALSLTSVLLAMPISMLPRAWRERVSGSLPMGLGAGLSGAAELVTGCLIVSVGGFHAVRELLAMHTRLTFIDGAAAFIVHMFSPLGLFALAMAFEGMIRVAHALATRSAFGSFPLWVAEKLWSAWHGRHQERKLGARVVDQVTRNGDVLHIASCRPRDWDNQTSLEHDGEYWEVQSTEHLSSGERPYHFKLRPWPKHRILRRIHRYSPDEMLSARRRSKA